MDLKERNYAGDHLVVGSLEVLGDVKSANMQQIKNNLEQVRTSQTMFIKKQDRYWTELSSDGIITPYEKRQLLKEMESITRRQAAIMEQAESVGLEHTASVVLFYNTFIALHDYIYGTLKLFDDMQLNTEIPDREAFNYYFANYYYQESFVNVVLTKGIADSINFRVLDSLSEPGEENEIAFYHGGIYMYTNGVWKNMTTSAYRGILNYLPPSEEDCFFLAGEDFVSIDVFGVNGEEFYVNGDKFAIQKTFLRAYIYYCENGSWFRDDDTHSYRYVAAFADYLYLTGELPSIFQDAIDEAEARLNERIDEVVAQSQQDLQDEITARQGQYTVLNNAIVQINETTLPPIIANLNAQGQKISHLPVNYGPQLSAPSDAVEGDYYLYTGASVTGRHYLYIQQYTNNEWVERSPTDSNYASLYMMNLEEILLQTPDLESGYFNAVFAASFIGNAATVNKLATQTLYLRQGGFIQSDNVTYQRQRLGMRIDSAGNIDANGDTHIAGKVAIGVDLYDANGQYEPDFDDYDVVIGGAVKIKGTGAIDASNVNGLAPVATGGNLAANLVTGLAGVATGGDLAASKVDGLASVATSGSYDDLTDKPEIPGTENLVSKDVYAQKLGYANWDDLNAQIAAGNILISGGYLNAVLIQSEALRAKIALIDNLEVNASGTFGGTVNASGGTFTGKETVNGTMEVNGKFVINGEADYGGIGFINYSYKAIGITTVAYRIESVDDLLRTYGILVSNVRNKFTWSDRAFFKISGNVTIGYKEWGADKTIKGQACFLVMIYENGSIDTSRTLLYFMADTTMFFYDTDGYLYTDQANMSGNNNYYPYNAVRVSSQINSITAILMINE